MKTCRERYEYIKNIGETFDWENSLEESQKNKDMGLKVSRYITCQCCLKINEYDKTIGKWFISLGKHYCESCYKKLKKQRLQIGLSE